MTITRPLLATLLAFAASVPAVSAQQLIFADNFNVTGGNSPASNFSANGVNYEISSRLSGAAFDANSSLSLLRTTTGKAASAYSIANNQLAVADLAGIGSFQYSANGTAAFDFGGYLVGQIYEIKLTLNLAETETTSRRASFYLADNIVSDVTVANYGFQIASNTTIGGTESIYQRIRGNANSTGSNINSSVQSALPFNTPVDLRLVVTDSADYTPGTFASTYQLYVNDSLASSGSFRFANNERYLVFDVAPNSGPVTYDNFSVTVVPEPSTIALGLVGLFGVFALRRRIY